MCTYEVLGRGISGKFRFRTLGFCYSPALVAGDANLEASGRRITFGRFVNAGQVCIAVDYVICMRDQRDKLVEVIKNTITEFFGEVN